MERVSASGSRDVCVCITGCRPTTTRINRMIIPIPTDNEPEPEEPGKLNHARIAWYLTWPTWKCSVCGTTMSGGSLYCAYCQIRNRVRTNRPVSYKEPEYEGDYSQDSQR